MFIKNNLNRSQKPIFELQPIYSVYLFCMLSSFQDLHLFAFLWFLFHHYRSSLVMKFRNNFLKFQFFIISAISWTQYFIIIVLITFELIAIDFFLMISVRLRKTEFLISRFDINIESYWKILLLFVNWALLKLKWSALFKSRTWWLLILKCKRNC